MDDDFVALARCVDDVEHFAQEIWGRHPHVWRERGPFSDLLSTDDVEQLLGSAARRPSFRLVRDGVTLPPSSYTRSVRIGGTVVDDAADLERIMALTIAGATIVLQGLHHLWPPMKHFCASLERASSHPVQANAYLSPAGSAGLRHHTDTHHVLVLQVEGAKAWAVEGLGPLALDAGGVLYLPAGTGHAAAAQCQHSLHITIGVLATTYGQVLRRALEDDEDELGRPLPLGFARPGMEDELRAELARALKTGAERLGAAEPAAAAAREIKAVADRPRHAPRGTLRALIDPAAIGDESGLSREPTNELRILDDGDYVVLEGNGRRLRVPAHAGPALGIVIARPALQVGELFGLDAPSRAVLARRLVREGFVRFDPAG